MSSQTPFAGSAHDSDGPQDTRTYRAPIPHVDDAPGPGHAPGNHERRYVKSEPLNSSPFGATGGFGAGFGGQGGSARRGDPAFAGTPFPFALAPGARLPRKSLALAALLSLILGPFGMAYSTLFGAFVMIGVVFWTAILFHPGVPFVWLIGVFWAVSAAHRRNSLAALVERRLA